MIAFEQPFVDLVKEILQKKVDAEQITFVMQRFEDDGTFDKMFEPEMSKADIEDEVMMQAKIVLMSNGELNSETVTCPEKPADERSEDDSSVFMFLVFALMTIAIACVYRAYVRENSNVSNDANVESIRLPTIN